MLSTVVCQKSHMCTEHFGFPSVCFTPAPHLRNQERLNSHQLRRIRDWVGLAPAEVSNSCRFPGRIISCLCRTYLAFAPRLLNTAGMWHVTGGM